MSTNVRWGPVTGIPGEALATVGGRYEASCSCGAWISSSTPIDRKAWIRTHQASHPNQRHKLVEDLTGEFDEQESHLDAITEEERA